MFQEKRAFSISYLFYETPLYLLSIVSNKTDCAKKIWGTNFDTKSAVFMLS